MGTFKNLNRETAKKNIEKLLADGKITQDEYNRKIARLETTGAGIDKENKNAIRKTMAKVGEPTQEQIANAAAMRPPAPASQGNKGLAQLGMNIGRFADAVSDTSTPGVFDYQSDKQNRIQQAAQKAGLTPEQTAILIKELGA